MSENTMSRPRIPTEMLDARGSFIAQPSREKARAGDPPERLDGDCKAVWVEIADQLAPGVACVSDRQMFEVLVRLVVKLRAGKIRIMELSCLISLCGRFGMAPSDRSKVAVNAEPSNALTRFLKTYQSGEPS
jgi:phage terminase small subunit